MADLLLNYNPDGAAQVTLVRQVEGEDPVQVPAEEFDVAAEVIPSEEGYVVSKTDARSQVGEAQATVSDPIDARDQAVVIVRQAAVESGFAVESLLLGTNPEEA